MLWLNLNHKGTPILNHTCHVIINCSKPCFQTKNSFWKQIYRFLTFCLCKQGLLHENTTYWQTQHSKYDCTRHFEKNQFYVLATLQTHHKAIDISPRLYLCRWHQLNILFHWYALYRPVYCTSSHLILLSSYYGIQCDDILLTKIWNIQRGQLKISYFYILICLKAQTSIMTLINSHELCYRRKMPFAMEEI